MKMKIKTAADILMTAALPVLMCYSIAGETAHEVIGIAMFGLFILHHILNFGWIKSLFKSKYCHHPKRTHPTHRSHIRYNSKGPATCHSSRTFLITIDCDLILFS